MEADDSSLSDHEVHAVAVDDDDRYRVNFMVNNVFDESYASLITPGGPGGSFRYLVPRDADQFFGVNLRYNFGGR